MQHQTSLLIAGASAACQATPARVECSVLNANTPRDIDCTDTPLHVALLIDLLRTTEDLQRRTAELTAMAADLERSQEYFRALIEDSSELILIIEPDSRIRYTSPSVEHLLGYSSQQLLGQPIGTLLHPDDMAILRSDLALVQERGGTNPPKDQRWRHKDGSYRFIEWVTSNHVRTPSIAGLVVHARDVTDRNRAEAQVRALNTELDRRVTERTAALEGTIEALLARSASA